MFSGTILKIENNTLQISKTLTFDNDTTLLIEPNGVLSSLVVFNRTFINDHVTLQIIAPNTSIDFWKPLELRDTISGRFDPVLNDTERDLCYSVNYDSAVEKRVNIVNCNDNVNDLGSQPAEGKGWVAAVVLVPLILIAVIIVLYFKVFLK